MRKRVRRSKYSYLDSVIRRDIFSIKKQVTRKDRILLDSGFYDTETWGGLRKCWKGYKIAKSEHDYKKMEHYARGIRKFERELKISVTDFPQFGLMGTKTPHEQDPENVFDYGFSCAQIEKERKEHEWQVEQEQKLDPYRIEPEPNSLKEQEEYYRQIRRYFMDPGSFAS